MFAAPHINKFAEKLQESALIILCYLPALYKCPQKGQFIQLSEKIFNFWQAQLLLITNIFILDIIKNVLLKHVLYNTVFLFPFYTRTTACSYLYL